MINKLGNVQHNTTVHLHNHGCHGNATLCSLYWWYTYVAVNNTELVFR